MSDELKIQMTEEQADQIYDAFLYKASNEIGRQQFKNELKSNGFIRKSKLQTLVDEAEEIIDRITDFINSRLSGYVIGDNEINKLSKVIQQLKVDHPEFKK